MITIDSPPRQVDVRVGTYHTSRIGPLGTTNWEHESLRRFRGPVDLHYQDTSYPIIDSARINVHDTEIPCAGATVEELKILDNSFSHVPPRHLQLALDRRPGGFEVASSAGRGTSLSYMGGTNRRSTIVITHGALWEHRELFMSPTVLHEIGHTMTHRAEISYQHFLPARRQALEGSNPSRNPGSLEGLCNAYMYLLCYGSPTDDVRSYGSGSTDQNDAETREALRACRAFTGLINEEWTVRLAER